MISQMHQELFAFYKLTSAEEKQKRTIRSEINKRLERKFESRKWNELSETEKQEFKLVTIKDYMLGQILYPDHDRKTEPTKRAKDKVRDIERKIEEEIRELHKPLVFIEEHNKEQDILRKDFYNPSASKEENSDSFQEFCKYHKQYFGHELKISFEEWIRNPLTLFDLSKEYEFEADHANQDNDDFDEPVTQLEIIEEEIACILKVLNISIDVDEIIRCKKATRNISHLNYEKMDKDSRDISIAASLIKLNNHDFIIKKEG